LKRPETETAVRSDRSPTLVQPENVSIEMKNREIGAFQIATVKLAFASGKNQRFYF
jgi:hypothetical protein